MNCDTVTLAKGFEPFTDSFWQGAGFREVGRGRLARNLGGVNLTVYPRGRGFKDWLLAQASLPKILFGHNVTLPSESQAREAAALLCGRVSRATGLTFTLDDVKASRIDYTRDYEICEDRSREVALKLVAMDLPRFTRVIREEDSICFIRNSGRKTVKTITVYPKFAETVATNQAQNVVELARGKLRLEVRLMGDGLKGIKGATKPIDYFSESIADSLLREAENMLDLKRIIDGRSVDFHGVLLVHALGHGQLGKGGLPTFLELVRRYGEGFYRNLEISYPKSTYYNNRNALRRLGLWDDLVAASEARRL